jgi:hypothetical protein
MIKKIQPELYYPLVLIIISAFLCFKNYTPGTNLIGWDSLHPEFNFPVAFGRAWEGVWRAEQGVGAIAAHSHMADLPRIILLWLESFVLPASLLRYSYIFLCLIVGPLGVYFFLKYVFQKEKESVWIYPAAFLGALFYLLNLGTLQNFYVPFEMFPAAFAFLPWLFFSGLKYLRVGKKLDLIFWAVVVILSSPMAYAATLWYATFAGLFIFFAFYSLISSSKGEKLGRLWNLGIIAILLNSYWILPSIYSIINQSGVISNAATNRLFSPEAFLRNAAYGDIKDVLLSKNFLFGWRNFDFAGGKFVDLLGEWSKYLANPLVLEVGYALAGVAVLGLIFGIIKREKVSLAMIPALFFVLFFLLNINPPLGNIYAYLYNHFGIFAEGLRMPFTKFSILYEFIASFYFGYFAFVILTVRPRFLIFIKLIFVGVTFAGLIYFMLPGFNGQLIGGNVEKAFPPEYQQMFNWFNSNAYGRIALMPINSKYGWEYRSWGYEGSGFLTFGISDPILYRDFDRWSAGNEDFYTQASFALYSGNVQDFIGTLKKYQVKYVLLDESIINPGGTPDILKIPELKSIFAGNGIRETANFGFLTIYETGFGGEEVSVPPEFTGKSSDFSYSPVDPEFANGDYINSGTNSIRKTLSLPPGAPIISEDFSLNRGFPNAYNCDLMKSGSVFKSNSSLGILLQAGSGGASCDYLPYPDLKYSQAYILRVAGENKEGRSLKIYLFDESSEVPEIEEILPSGNFDKNYLIYPKEATGSGYILNLETRSFGRIPSENLLSKVEFYAVDANYLQSFEGYNPGAGQTAIQNNLKITGVQKLGVWGYKVGTSGTGLLELGQGFEKGWVALSMINDKWQMLSHVKVDSWANGWMVTNSPTVYIFYWPQLFEWGGGVLGIITFLFLLLL